MQSVRHLSLRDALLSSALLNNSLYGSSRYILIQKFFIIAWYCLQIEICDQGVCRSFFFV